MAIRLAREASLARARNRAVPLFFSLIKLEGLKSLALAAGSSYSRISDFIRLGLWMKKYKRQKSTISRSVRGVLRRVSCVFVFLSVRD